MFDDITYEAKDSNTHIMSGYHNSSVIYQEEQSHTFGADGYCTKCGAFDQTTTQISWSGGTAWFRDKYFQYDFYRNGSRVDLNHYPLSPSGTPVGSWSASASKYSTSKADINIHNKSLQRVYNPSGSSVCFFNVQFGSDPITMSGTQQHIFYLDEGLFSYIDWSRTKIPYYRVYSWNQSSVHWNDIGIQINFTKTTFNGRPALVGTHGNLGLNAPIFHLVFDGSVYLNSVPRQEGSYPYCPDL